MLIDFIMPLFYKIFPPGKQAQLVMLGKQLEEGEIINKNSLLGRKQNDEGYERALRNMKLDRENSLEEMNNVYEEAYEKVKKLYESRKEKWDNLITLHQYRLSVVKKAIEDIKREIGNE